MKPGIPWSVKGIEPEVREAAKHAARKAGMTLGEWLNTVILDQSDEPGGDNPPGEQHQHEDFFDAEAEMPAAPAVVRRDETTVRLEDIAQQLSRLAQRERESATIMPYEPPRGRNQDGETLNRILNRIDSNERQTVEAFTAVNDRLSTLGRQIAMAAKPKTFDKPEDVPGFSSLEAAIRNVVEHIELSERRTRDSLKTMQDRLGEMSQRATHANADDLVRTAPAFASLEARMSELSTRLQRSEAHQQSLPDAVRHELNQLADRIETVHQSSETLASKAQSAAVGTAQRELRDIEGRILGLLKEAQTTLGSQSSTAADLQRLRADIGSLNKRIDDVGSSTASDRDVHALRVAVEQLSTRVAQGPDMRPLAEMDKRLGEITRRLEQNHAATRNLPQFGELERRIAELDHRLAEAVRLQGDGHAVTALEQQISVVSERLGRTEAQLGNLETMEQAIHQLYQGLEDNRAMASQVAEDAANRAAERVMAVYKAQPAEPSHELMALKDGLQAVRDSAANSDQRNQETLEAVHETLEQIVNKLAELETSTAGHQIAANMAQQAMAPQPAAAQPAPGPAWAADAVHPVSGSQQASQTFFDPHGAFSDSLFEPHQAQEPKAFSPEPVMPDLASPASSQDPTPAPAQPLPDFAAGGMEGDDDFIAAARRAAHAAASRTNSPDAKPVPKPGANSRFKLSLPFLKGEKSPPPVTYVGGKPVAEQKPTAANSNKRKKLILAGIVLLAAVSAFTFNILARSSKPAKQTTSIEQPLASDQAQALEKVASLPAHPAVNYKVDEGLLASTDGLITGSLSARKTDASLSSIIAEPGIGSGKSEMPAPEVGNQALREAAGRGDAKAQFIVAGRYLDGQGVEQDLPKAAHWYQLAASHGLAPAQYRLATLFERGKGVPQDVATALLWYERAAEGGNIKAMHNAAVIAAGNQAGTPNYDKAYRWFKAAAEHGLKDSQFNLAVLIERGLGTKIDKPTALMWYTLAGMQGDKDAAKRGEQLSATLSGGEVASINDLVRSWQPVPAMDDANVVAITDPAWDNPSAATSSSMEPADTANEPEAMAPAESLMAPAPDDPVTEAQKLLMRLGFNVGEADGKMGTRTHNAIRLFQLQSGLKVTGDISPDLLDAMRAKAG